MKLILPDDLKTVDDWHKFYPPKRGDYQWKVGRSATELANYFITSVPNVPVEISEYLSKIGIKDASFCGRPEAVTNLFSFGLGKGEGRNHDFLMLSDSQSQCVVCIEAKVDEPFSERLGKYYVPQNSSKSNRNLRIEKLCEMIYGNKPLYHLNIRYQLLTAIAGTLLEAKIHDYNTAVLLIIVLKKQPSINNTYYNNQKILANRNDLNDFLRSLNVQNDGKVFTVFGSNNNINTYVYEIVKNIP